MTTEVTPADALQNWWTNTNFKGKEFCTLTEAGELVLRQNGDPKGRTIAHLTVENADAAIKALVDKFSEIDSRFRELEQECTTATDRLKLIGKVTRFKDYLLHTTAIGDFDRMLTEITRWENEINELIEVNYKEKLALLEQAERLAAESENWKEAGQALKELGEKWKQIGYVDKERNDKLWQQFEATKNIFFERKRKFQEDQEKEMLANLDLKMEMVEKAEQLATSENWKETTEQFRQLMNEWKATGRTVHDKNEELWNRFIQAKNHFFDRKKAHFDKIAAEQEANYAQKLVLLERAEALKDSTEWNKTAQAYAELWEQWKSIGKVPAEKSDEIWNRLNAARDHFFNNRRQHLEALKVTQEDNYAQKRALLKRAEEIKNSVHWRETTEEMNELLTEWKKIGKVPKEHADIWDQFLAARKYFFERKDADRERRKQQAEKQFEVKYEKTKAFIAQLESELREEQERLADFHHALENVTPGNKADELRAHLTKLISQSEVKINHKKEKIKDVTAQLQELEAKRLPAEATPAETQEQQASDKQSSTEAPPVAD